MQLHQLGSLNFGVRQTEPRRETLNIWENQDVAPLSVHTTLYQDRTRFGHDCKQIRQMILIHPFQRGKVRVSYWKFAWTQLLCNRKPRYFQSSTHNIDSFTQFYMIQMNRMFQRNILKSFIDNVESKACHLKFKPIVNNWGKLELFKFFIDKTWPFKANEIHIRRIICKATTVTHTKRIDRNLLRKETSFVCYTSSVLRKSRHMRQKKKLRTVAKIKTQDYKNFWHSGSNHYVYVFNLTFRGSKTFVFITAWPYEAERLSNSFMNL